MQDVFQNLLYLLRSQNPKKGQKPKLRRLSNKGNKTYKNTRLELETGELKTRDYTHANTR